MVTRTYERGDLTVYWEAERCIHTAVCLNALPQVFDVRRRPWIRLDAASADEVVAAVEKCPTGALRYERAGRPEPAPAETTMTPIPNGPLVVRGSLRVTDARTGAATNEVRVTLCRCGHSGNQPFCDNSHRRVRFEEVTPPPNRRQRADAESPKDICPPQEFEIP